MSATSSMQTSRERSDALHELVQRIGQGGPHLPRQMRVDLGGAGAAVAQVLLDDPQVPGLQQVGGVRMAQGVDMGALVDATLLQGPAEGTLPAAAGCG